MLIKKISAGLLANIARIFWHLYIVNNVAVGTYIRTFGPV
jgi:hypothetical protein